jgi:hypothetical protein
LCAFVNGFAGHAMKRRLGRTLLAVVLTCLVAQPLHAATLEAIRGHVMVNRGAGYEFARGSVEVVPGDMIIANAGGNAQLIFVAAASWWKRALSLPLGKARRAPAGTMLEHSALLPPRSLLVPWRLAAVLVPLCCSARVATSLRAHRGAWRHNGTGQSTTWH